MAVRTTKERVAARFSCFIFTEGDPALNLIHQTNPFAGIGQGLELFPRISEPFGLLLPQPNKKGLWLLGKPVRKVRANPRSVTGSVPFPLLRRTVSFESSGERDFLLVLKGAPFKLGILEQPLTLSPKMLGYRGGKYTPDFLVWLVDPLGKITQVVLVEVKHEDFLGKDLGKYRDRLKAGRRFAARNGWAFRLITGRRTRSQEIPEVVWPSFHLPEPPLLDSSVLLPRLFPYLPRSPWNA